MADAAEEMIEFQEIRWERIQAMRKWCGKPDRRPRPCNIVPNDDIGGTFICTACKKHFD